MPLNAERVRQRLGDFALEPLFIEELGWDRYPGRLDVSVDGETYTLRGIAEKRGMVAFALEAAKTQLPAYPLRRKIERLAARSVHEHLIVYIDGERTTQIWQWVGRESGRATPREHIFQHGQSGKALIQKLDRLVFTLDEEPNLTIIDVTQRARAAFDVERVTRRFYDRFKAEHEAFLGFITGLKGQADLEWYASVMLNRLMFVYFIQRKGFLDRDRDYLRNRLRRLQNDAGPDQFHTFYRHFLLRLFHEGLGSRQRTSELDTLLGQVPYLNGGLFDVHELERAYPNIQIPDEAFERLFDFFDAYQWHLDDRPLRQDNEVNPDVLGYIFEKYVNQKQMGAYYTKEDITEYITSNTLLPRLFEKLAAGTEFDLDVLARLLATEPDRYIHPPLRHGAELDLPAEIAAGVEDPTRRDSWNSPAPQPFALPTETWREVVARRKHYAELRDRLAACRVDEASELVALNINLRRLAEDTIEGCDSPHLLLGIFRTLESLSVLDPTCGSGAFLFAALNILEPLYEAALERMEAFVVDADADEEDAEFAAITERVNAHPNPTFFVLKTIVVNNLYGVDIMEEAIEICKLRLFLRLVSQIDRVEHLEPLPDIDFNVRGGNTLIGFSSLADLRTALSSTLDLEQTAGRVEEATAQVDEAFARFRGLQLGDIATDGEVVAAKRALRERLQALRAELDAYLAAQWGRSGSDEGEYRAWCETHLPFHWFVEFHEIMSGEGFDAVIGNPPFVEYSKVRDQYTVRGFETLPCNNLYAFVLERSLQLTGGHGRMGMISPLSLVCTARMAPMRQVLHGRDLHIPSFDIRPNPLFEGVTQRLCFVFAAGASDGVQTWAAGYRRWLSPERPTLLPTEHYTVVDDRRDKAAPLPKFSVDLEKSIRAKLGTGSLEMLVERAAEPIYIHRIVRYFVKALDFVPVFIDAEGSRGRSEDYKEFRFKGDVKPFVLALLNSSLFYWFWRAYSDGFHCGYGDVYLFPHEHIEGVPTQRFGDLSARLMDALRANSADKTISTKRGPIRYQEFYAKPVKPLLDEIDEALAEHYGLSGEELDFIVSYDLKYRIGSDG
jgi:hypothetical protein